MPSSVAFTSFTASSTRAFFFMPETSTAENCSSGIGLVQQAEGDFGAAVREGVFAVAVRRHPLGFEHGGEVLLDERPEHVDTRHAASEASVPAGAAVPTVYVSLAARA